jgi:hypothetical protein
MLIPKCCNSWANDATASICCKSTLFSAVGYFSPGCCGGNILIIQNLFVVKMNTLNHLVT